MPPDRTRENVVRRDTWLWDMLEKDRNRSAAWFAERFGILKEALLQGNFRRDAAIVPELGSRSRLASVEISGGRDVKYVVVYAREVPTNGRPEFRETLTYRPDVAGTDLIYDLTGEFLQGKARPFVGDFRSLPLRVYAVLPFQVEQIDLAAQQRVAAKYMPEQKADRVSVGLRLKFQDATGASIAGRLPIFLGLRRDEPRETSGRYTFADDQGRPERFVTHLDSTAGEWSLVTRLLLTGVEWSLPLDFVPAKDGIPVGEAPLTTHGLTTTSEPQPVSPRA